MVIETGLHQSSPRRGQKKVIFTDLDTFYFSDHQFLFAALDDSKILLTPHWRGKDPNADSVNFDLQFVGGLYNAGFIGVRHDAREVMDWWDASLAQMMGLWVVRRPGFNRFFRLFLKLIFLPPMALMMRIDSKPDGFSEGQMVSGLCGVAKR